MKRDDDKIILFLGVIAFLFVNILTLKNGHNWGDDFSQYIVHAKNIVEHRPYTQGLILNAWEICPPGFPLLLAPLVKFFGVNFQILKFWNIPCWLVASYFLFLIAKKRIKKSHAVLLFVYLLSSPFFFFFKQSVLSDVPFLAFLAAALFTWTQYFDEGVASKNKQPILFFGALGLTTCAFIIRYGPGLILFLSIILYLIFVKKKIIPALMTAIILLATLGGLTLFGVNLMTHAKDVPESFLKTIASAPAMFAYSFACLVSLLTPNVTIFSFSIVKFLTHLVSLFAVPVGLAVYGIFTIKAIKAKTSFVEWFFLLYLLAVTFWNVPDGIRYLLPISGLAGIFIIENFDNITRKIAALKTRTFSFPEMDLGSLFLFILLFFNIINIAQRFSFNDDEILKPPTTALVQKMQSVMKEGEVFTAVRARALCLLTGRPGVELRYPFDYFARDFNVVYFVKLKPRWALEKGWDEESVEKWYASILDFSPIWENESFIIFKIAAKKQSLGDLQD